MSESQRKRPPMSEEIKRKISEKNKGKKRTNEQRKHLSNAKKRYSYKTYRRME